jgi:hypothetical protein
MKGRAAAAGNNNNALHSQLAATGVIDATFSLCFGYPNGGGMFLGAVPDHYNLSTSYTPLLTNLPWHYYNVKASRGAGRPARACRAPAPALLRGPAGREGVLCSRAVSPGCVPGLWPGPASGRAEAAGACRAAPQVSSMGVGGKALQVDPALFDEGYGSVMDSGTTFTYLPSLVFKAFTEAVEAAVLQKGLKRTGGLDPQYDDVCWKGAPASFEALRSVFPTATLALSGGVVLQLLPHRYLFMAAVGEYCLGMFDNKDHGTLIGSITVRNMLVQYDKQHRRVGFAEMDCHELGNNAQRSFAANSLHLKKAAAGGGAGGGGGGGSADVDLDLDLEVGGWLGPCCSGAQVLARASAAAGARATRGHPVAWLLACGRQSGAARGGQGRADGRALSEGGCRRRWTLCPGRRWAAALAQPGRSGSASCWCCWQGRWWPACCWSWYTATRRAWPPGSRAWPACRARPSGRAAASSQTTTSSPWRWSPWWRTTGRAALCRATPAPPGSWARGRVLGGSAAAAAAAAQRLQGLGAAAAARCGATARLSCWGRGYRGAGWVGWWGALLMNSQVLQPRSPPIDTRPIDTSLHSYI